MAKDFGEVRDRLDPRMTVGFQKPAQSTKSRDGSASRDPGTIAFRPQLIETDRQRQPTWTCHPPTRISRARAGAVFRWENEDNLGNLDVAAILRRAIDGTSESIWTATALVHPALDAINASVGEASSRVLARHMPSEHFNFVSMLAVAGILCHVATPLMRTMVPLRISFIFSDLFLIGYGALSGSYITLSLYMLLLPINSIRLYQMLKLVKKARVSAQGDKSMNWLKPFTTQRKYEKGDVLFHKGDPANEMFFTVTGKLLVTEIGVELPPGRLVGETRLSLAQQPANDDGRMHRKRRGADHHI